MNWFKANKFLAGLLAVVALGGGVLGYLLFTAKGRADEAMEKYTQASSTLKGLRSSPVYPNAKNLATLETQRAEHQERVDEMVESLAGMAPTLEPISPEQFQDKLRETVNAFVKDAAAGNMVLPKAFYMGFDVYQGTPPRPEAAPYLARSLKAVDFILRQLLSARVSELKSLKRDPLVEESKGGGGSGTAKGGKPATAAASEVMKKRTFEITFYGEQIATQKVLNGLTAEKKWFVIPRWVHVKNEKLTGPLKEDPSSATASNDLAPAAPASTPAQPGQPPAPAVKAFQFIVGEEKVETTMLLEVTIFNQADAKESVAKPKGKK